MEGMTFTTRTPAVTELDQVLAALRAWQGDDLPLQLHPGDVGWFWRLGAERTAAALRTWRRGGRILAVGLLDGPGLVRLAVDPAAHQDDHLARRLADDISDPARGVLPEGAASVEAPAGTLVRDRLGDAGWQPGEPWTPLHRDLSDPVPDPGLRVEVTGPAQAATWAAVVGAAFGNPASDAARWRTLASGPAYADARSLVGHDGTGAPVAAVTVWSAGPGRPGLIEPLGVHPDHRGHGHGRAITVAAAAALREMGAASAHVCTPRSNAPGVGAYVSAGFAELGDTPDLTRAA